MGLRLLFICALFTAAFSGCATNPVTGETEIRLISTAEEVEMGGRIDAQVREQHKVATGSEQARRIERIGRTVAAVSDRDEFPYYFALLDTQELNAFAAPGGYIYVTTELAGMADDDELAAVMAHEVGHVAAHHSVNQLQRALGYSILRDLIFGDKTSEAAVAAADIAFNNVIMTGFSREAEYEADELGVKYAARARFDPYGLARFFEKLRQREQRGVFDRNFEFMRSHPDTDKRLARAQQLAGRYGGSAHGR